MNFCEANEVEAIVAFPFVRLCGVAQYKRKSMGFGVRPRLAFSLFYLEDQTAILQKVFQGLLTSMIVIASIS